MHNTERDVDYTQEYVKFKKEMSPEISRYERWAKSLGNIIKLKISEKDSVVVKRNLNIAHLDIEPQQSVTLSAMAFLSVLFLGVLISVAWFLISGSFPILFFLLVMMFCFFVFYFVSGYPARLANSWRLKASSQMVPAILYIVVYMRHTSNLERAVAFASDHLEYPLALDFKKIFYDVQIGKFATIKDSLDNYLETWRDYSIEFIESFHLIENSLFEPDDAMRIQTLEKSLSVVLDGVYEKMLKFTYEVKNPLTNVYMLGVVLPTLGLALLPLASAMLGGMLTWVHVFILFDLIIPFLVLYLTDKVLFLRPGGNGDSSLLEKNPLYYKYKNKKPYFKAFFIAFPFLLIGLLPFIFQFTPLPQAFGMPKDFTFSQIGLGILGGNANFFDFRTNDAGGLVGPFGVGALLLSILIPLSIALFFSIVYKEKTKELIVERKKTNQLEAEFNNSLFQLGNTIGNGTPPEIAFGKVAEASKGLITEDFFNRVNYNIRQMGMSIEKALFDSKRGAVIYYPSNLISTSMKILAESSKKGLQIAALSLMSISEYVKNMNKVTARLKDLLAEVISDMKSNMSFLAPLLSGVVVGLAAMITSILVKMDIIKSLGGSVVASLGTLANIVSIFQVSDMIPPYFLQVIIGIYLIEIVFILTRALVVIDSGEDKLEKTSKTGKNLTSAILLYAITAFLSIIVLFVLVSIVVVSS